MRSYLLNTTFPPVAKFTHGKLTNIDGGNLLKDFSRDSGANPFEADVYTSSSHLWDEREQLARRICWAAGAEGGVFLTTTGSEAIEAAIKFARRWRWCNEGKVPGQMASRNRVYYQLDDFHGRTMAALAATSGPMYYFDGFGPSPKGFYPFADANGIDWSLAAAVILSPIRSPTGDMILPNTKDLVKIREMCQLCGVTLIFDEIQTGSGRTGRWLFGGSEELPIKPDISVMGKGMAAGFPVGATIIHNEEQAKCVEPGTHYSTFSGNVYTVTFIEKMMDKLGYPRHPLYRDEMKDTPFLAGIRELGAKALELLSKYPFQKVRGRGLMLAFDVDVDVKHFAAAARRQGVLIPAFRNGPGTVKLYPPLDSSVELLESVFDSLGRAYKEAIKQ